MCILIGIPIIFLPQLVLMYDLPKTALLITSVSIFWTLLIWKILATKTISFPKINKFFWIFLGLFLASFIISTILSESTHLSFFGSYWRQNGLLQLIFYFLLFLGIVIYFSDKKQTKDLPQLIKYICYGGILSAIYAIWQSISSGMGLRVFGTIGQPNSLATYLLMVAPFILVYFFQSKTRKTNIFWGIGLFLVFLAMALTISRTMIVGILGIIIFLAIFYRKWIFLSLIGCFFLSVLAINLLSNYSFISENIFLSRFIFKGWAFHSVESRFVIWESVLKMIQAKPITGYGPDMLSESYLQFANPQIFYFEKIDNFVDRAHNELLDITVNQGIVGLISYLGLLLTTLKIAFKKIGEQLVLAAICSLIGLFAANMFNFSTTVNYTIWWAIVAFLITTNAKAIIHKINLAPVSRIIIGIIISIIFIPTIYLFGIKPVLADYYYANGDLEKAIITNPNEIFYQLQAAQQAINDNQTDEAEAFLEKTKKTAGTELAEYLFLKGRLEILKENYEEAINYFKKADAKNKVNPNIPLEWARLLNKMQKYPESLDKYDEYFSIMPFWQWATEFENKNPQEQSRFKIFFNEYPEVIEVLQEAKTEFYKNHHDKINVLLYS